MAHRLCWAAVTEVFNPVDEGARYAYDPEEATFAQEFSPDHPSWITLGHVTLGLSPGRASRLGLVAAAVAALLARPLRRRQGGPR